MNSIAKLCANHLRVYSSTHGIKLKSSHAHELIAAFFGYKSKAAMLADTLCPIENLAKAQILVLMPSLFIDERRKCLDELPDDLPNTYILAVEMHGYLISAGALSLRPFPTWGHLAEAMFDESMQNCGGLISTSKSTLNDNVEIMYNKPLYEYKPNVESTVDGVKLTVSNRFYRSADHFFQPIDVTFEIRLNRVAGHVGYANPEISIVRISDQSVDQTEVI